MSFPPPPDSLSYDHPPLLPGQVNRCWVDRGDPVTLTASAADYYFFFSFDTLQSGNGSFTSLVTAENFPGVPTFSKTATATNFTENGGALNFTDF